MSTANLSRPTRRLTPAGTRSTRGTNLVDKSLTIEGLRDLGSKLTLPPGWKYEVKTLDRELTYEPVAPRYAAYFISDNLQNAYQGCGFDNACNYSP